MKTYIANSAKSLIAAAFISAGVALSAPAYAMVGPNDIVTTTIDVRDLETDRGVKHVYKSLERRAESACYTVGAKSLNDRNAEKTCAEDLLIDFVLNVDNERLSAYHVKMQS